MLFFCFFVITAQVYEWTFKYLWCIREFDLDDYVTVADKVGHRWIAKQIIEYAEDTNTTRDPKVDLEIHSNGTINKYLINALPNVLGTAADICDKIAAQNGRIDESGTTMMCVLMRVSALMRKCFGTVLKEKFEFKNDETPVEILEMIENVKLATYITYHLCDDLVCYNIL